MNKIMWMGVSNVDSFKLIYDIDTLRLGEISQMDENGNILFSSGIIQLCERVSEFTELLIYIKLSQSQCKEAFGNITLFSRNLLDKLKSLR